MSTTFRESKLAHMELPDLIPLTGRPPFPSQVLGAVATLRS